MNARFSTAQPALEPNRVTAFIRLFVDGVLAGGWRRCEVVKSKPNRWDVSYRVPEAEVAAMAGRMLGAEVKMFVVMEGIGRQTHVRAGEPLRIPKFPELCDVILHSSYELTL